MFNSWNGFKNMIMLELDLVAEKTYLNLLAEMC